MVWRMFSDCPMALPISLPCHLTNVQPYVHNRSTPPPPLLSPPLHGSEHLIMLPILIASHRQLSSYHHFLLTKSSLCTALLTTIPSILPASIKSIVYVAKNH